MVDRFDHVTDWIKLLDCSMDLPPMCLELFLRNGQSYYVRAVVAKDDESESVVIRIWDTRLLGKEDMDEMMSRLNKLKQESDHTLEPDKIHPKLDQANLRVHLADIAYCVEWHDRFWPQKAKEAFGFGRRSGG